MHRSAAVERFYTSRAWRKCRADFIKSRGGICEECWKKGRIETGSAARPLEVHHIIPLDDSNVTDPNITLSWSNLMLLCKDCHDKQKVKDQPRKRWSCDSDGRVIIS